jgi:hypothetical protein
MPPISDSNSNVDRILDLERLVLTTLCASSGLGGRRELILADLSRHQWRAPEHRVVYEALTRMRTADPSANSAELPAMATRMGFPDVDWDSYFVAGADPAATELEEIVRRLTAECTSEPGRP